MRRLVSSLSAAALLITAGVVTAVAPANAADPQIWTYSGTSGGTQVNALGTTISSGLTAVSNLADTVVPNSHTSTVAQVHVAGLLDVGAVNSGQTASRFATPGTDGNGVKIVSEVKIAGIDLLGGAIKVDAIDSASYATADSTTTGVKLDGGTSTTFLRLSIGGKAYPVNIAPNTTISIPGIATVVINESHVDKSIPGKTVRTIGAALHVTLLKARGNVPAGAEIWLNRTQALVVPTGKSDALPVGGFAYGSYIGIGAGDSVRVLSQPTGMVMLPSSGTNDQPYTNQIAGINIPKVAVVGAVGTMVSGKSIPGYSDSAAGADLANINLLGGLIKADAVNVSTYVQKAGTEEVSTARMNFVHLVIAGKKIPIDVAPNTQIYIFGVGQVYINQQLTQPGYAAIVGLRIILSTKRFGLPIGADIQVAVAASYVVGGGNSTP